MNQGLEGREGNGGRMEIGAGFGLRCVGKFKMTLIWALCFERSASRLVIGESRDACIERFVDMARATLGK